MNSYCGTDHWVCFFFFKRTADVLAPRFAVVFRQLIRTGNLPVCCRVANVTPVPKCPPSSSVANYRPISVTRKLPKVFGCLVPVRLGRFVELKCVQFRLPTTQFIYRKGLVTCNALLCMVHTLQNALETGHDAK